MARHVQPTQTGIAMYYQSEMIRYREELERAQAAVFEAYEAGFKAGQATMNEVGVNDEYS